MKTHNQTIWDLHMRGLSMLMVGVLITGVALALWFGREVGLDAALTFGLWTLIAQFIILCFMVLTMFTEFIVTLLLTKNNTLRKRRDE